MESRFSNWQKERGIPQYEGNLSKADKFAIEEADRADERKYLGKLLDTKGIAENVEAVKDAASRPIVADEAKKL